MRVYKIKVESPKGHVWLSEATYSTRDAAREEIRRRRREGGWTGCRFWTVPA